MYEGYDPKRIGLEPSGPPVCQHCGEAKAEVEVEIPIPENGREIVHLCVDCATEEDRGRAG